MTPRRLFASPPATPGPVVVRCATTRRELAERIRRARTLEHRGGGGADHFDVEAAARVYGVTAFLYRRYFRTECHGLAHLPQGRVMLVANHGSHALAFDGANILTACLLDAEPPRLVRPMADHRLMELPVLGRSARNIGAVDGQRATCMRILREGGAVLTFPEGTRAHDRRFRDRYQLSPFGHGFVRVALIARAPIVPVAVIGCEEEAPALANPRWLRRAMKTHAAPLTATLVVPLPVRYRLHFGEPIRLTGPFTAATVTAGVRTVRDALAALIARGLAARRHVFW
jgi:1-acyl-sn-glycerol-3-phosphate acyltransferase